VKFIGKVILGTIVVVVTLVVLLAMCTTAALSPSGNQSTKATPTPTEPPPGTTPAPTVAATPPLQLQAAPPVSFDGATNKKTTPFALGSPLKVDYTFNGDGNFIVQLTGTDGTPVASIANRIGPGKATTWVYGASGQAYFDVLANGPWTVKATAVVPAIAKLPLNLSGDSNVVTAPFRSTGTLTVKWVFNGSGNFIVGLIDATDGSQADSVANLIGPSSDSTQLYNHSGTFAFDVIADGPWTLTVSLTP
jgi:hypothetical protein